MLLKTFLSITAASPLIIAPLAMQTGAMGAMGAAQEAAPSFDYATSGVNDSLVRLVVSRRAVVIAARNAEITPWLDEYSQVGDGPDLQTLRVPYVLSTLYEKNNGVGRGNEIYKYTDYVGVASDPSRTYQAHILSVTKDADGNSHLPNGGYVVLAGDRKYKWNFKSVSSNTQGGTAIGSFVNTIVDQSGVDMNVNGEQLIDPVTGAVRYKEPGTAGLWAPASSPDAYLNWLHVRDGDRYDVVRLLVKKGDCREVSSYYICDPDTYENQYRWTSMGVTPAYTPRLPTTYFYDASQLFALDSVGYDPSRGDGGSYFYTLGLNKALISGAIGAYFEQATPALLSEELSESVVNKGEAMPKGADGQPAALSVMPSFNNRDGTKSEFWANRSDLGSLSWGPASWVDPALLSPNQYEQYWSNVEGLYQVLFGLNNLDTSNLKNAANKLFNYSNYTQTKRAVNEYVTKTRTFPSPDWVRSLFSAGADGYEPLKRGDWVDGAASYKLGEKSLDDLAFVLPFLRVSQWASYDTNGQQNWDNPSFRDNVGKSLAADNETRYSTYEEIASGSNRHYVLDDSTSADGTIKFALGVDILAGIQEARFDGTMDLGLGRKNNVKVQVNDSFNLSTTKKMGITTSNIAVVQPGGDVLSRVVQGNDGQQNFFSFSKKGFKVVELKDVLPNATISLRSGTDQLLASEAVATSEELSSSFLALRSRLAVEGGAGDAVVFPFALKNPYDGTWTYDLDPAKLAIVPDDKAGIVSVGYKGDDGKAVYSATIKGFKGYAGTAAATQSAGNSRQPAGDGFPDWAITVSSLGGAAVLGGLAWFLVARRRSLRRRHKKARGRDVTDVA